MWEIVPIQAEIITIADKRMRHITNSSGTDDLIELRDKNKERCYDLITFYTFK